MSWWWPVSDNAPPQIIVIPEVRTVFTSGNDLVAGICETLRREAQALRDKADRSDSSAYQYSNGERRSAALYEKMAGELYAQAAYAWFDEQSREAPSKSEPPKKRRRR